jgi:PAS domain S-box-containing protein
VGGEAASDGTARSGGRRQKQEEQTCTGLRLPTDSADGVAGAIRGLTDALGAAASDLRGMDGVNAEILRAALGNAEAAIAVFTRDRRFVALNDRYLELTGYSRAEALQHRVGDNLRLDPLGQDEFIALITAEVSSGEADILVKGGRPLAVEYVVIPTQIDRAAYFIGIMWPLVAPADAEREPVAREDSEV